MKKTTYRASVATPFKKLMISKVPRAVIDSMYQEAERETLSVSDIGRRILMRHYGLLPNESKNGH